MRRVLRRLSAGLLALVLLITYSVPLVGLAYDEQAAKAAASEDCRTWRQSDERWSNYPIGSSGKTIGGIGCFLTCSLVVIKMSGNAKAESQPLEFVSFLNSNGGFSPYGDLYFAPVYKYVTGVTMTYRYTSDPVYSSILSGKTTMVDKIKALVDAGCYTLIHVNNGGHWVLALGYDENDNIIVYDPAGQADLSAAAAPSRKTSYLLTEKYTVGGITDLQIIDIEGTLLTECTEFGGSGGANVKPNGITMNDIRASYGEDYWIENPVLEEYLSYTLMTDEFLSLDERDELADWKQTLEYKKEDKTHGVLRAVVMLVGIIIIVYSTLLFLAFQFDRINNFIDVPLLYFLSGGKMMTINEDEQSTYNQADNKGAKMMKQRDVCIMAVVGIAVGVLLLSGSLFEIISTIVSLIGKLLDKI